MNDDHSERTTHLVISRRIGESIVFPDLGISVELVKIPKHGGKFRLAVRAPETVRVIRGELLDDD